MSAVRSSEVVGLVPVAPESGGKHDAPIGTENRDLLKNYSVIPAGNGDFSTTYPAHASAAEVVNVAILSANFEISVEEELSQLPELVEKLSPDEDEERGVRSLVARAFVMGNVVGRPKTFDTTARAKFCILLKLGYNRSLAASQLGIHRSTVTKAMHSDPAFKRQVLRAEELYDSVPLLTILEAAQKDWRAAVWLKEHHDPHASMRRRRKRQAVGENLRIQDELNDLREAARERDRKKQQVREKAAKVKAAEEKKEEDRRFRAQDKIYRQQEKLRKARRREIRLEQEKLAREQNPQAKAEGLKRVAAMERELKELRKQQKEENERTAPS